MRRKNKDQLFEVADRQQGYFTSQQAEECGFHRSHFHRFLDSGEWIKETRGIYRLSRYPIQGRPELVLWSLWSRNKQGKPQGVWSHETALDIYELTDVMPSKMHMTVPVGFRRSQTIPNILVLHYQNLMEKEIEIWQGYKVTNPLRTIIDCVAVGTVADNFVEQAIKQALNRGLILEGELESLEEINPKIYQEIKRVIE